MIEFLKESNTFAGITFRGFYTVPLSDFEALYSHYKETGENLLDDYTEVLHMEWESDEIYSSKIDVEDFNHKMSCVCNMMRINFFDRNKMRELQYALRQAYKNYIQWEAYNSTKAVKRRKANGYTSDPSVRLKVIDKHGDKCLKCGATEEIQLDHVKPVSKGGKNEIDNLQPLCKSCNVSKGTKIEDYR